MENNEIKWLLKGKIVQDFRGYPIGKVKKLWYDESTGPLVIVERSGIDKSRPCWEAIPLREVASVTELIRLKPPTFAE